MPQLEEHMTRSLSKIVQAERSRAALAITTMMLLSTAVAAQAQAKGGPSSNGSTPTNTTTTIGGPSTTTLGSRGGSPGTKTGTAGGGTGSASTTVSVDMSPKNKLRFPYGVQSFEKKENIRLGNDLSVLPGWHFQTTPSMVDAIITENPNGFTRPGSLSRRWLDIEDLGGGATEGFTTPTIQAPSPWNYAWSFAFLVGAPPATGSEGPALAIQHFTNAGFQDAWGVRLTDTGAELFVNGSWGTAQVAELFQYAGATDVGTWIDVRVVASLQKDRLEAFVNGNLVASLRTRNPATTDVTKLRFAYHGGGAGNSTWMQLDDVGVAFLGPVCEESLNLTFTTEDDPSLLLVNGQDISTPPEFGNKVAINGSGPNRGAAIFDSSNPGPNNPGQDLDLLVNQGNVLILQNDAATNPPAVGGIFPRPNDDENGGTLQFDFVRPLKALSIDLIDIDLPNQGVTLTLTDFSALTRTYTVPSDWTGDLTLAQPGVGTLDLTTLAPQPGFASIATAVEDPGFDENAAVAMTIELSGSGAVDNFNALIPCVLLDFTNQDDKTPIFPGTPLVNGQDISTPPEFGVEVAITSAGPNAGSAIFDSTPGGPNDGVGKPDKDLLVGLGNILCLQNNLAAAQSVAGIFNVPNDDTEGGTVFFDFPGEVRVNMIDLIDVDEEESIGVTVTLLDSGGKTRTYTAPPSWTEDLLNDGPPGFRTLDLSTLAPQPGFAASATGVEMAGFNPNKVIKMTVDLGGAQDIDNICFCPQ